MSQASNNVQNVSRKVTTNPLVAAEANKEFNFGFIGAGNMAFAICSGLISKGVTHPSRIWASAPTLRNLQEIKALGCNTTHSNEEVIKHCNVVILCVKPFKVSEVLSKIDKEIWEGGDLFISVVSGVKIDTLAEFLPDDALIIRAIPNLPMLVHCGVLAYTLGRNCGESEEDIFREVFCRLAMCEKVPEYLINTVCGLSGSGTAYVFTVIQAMADGGVKMGLPRNLATKLAAQTVLGASKMVLETGKHPDVLRDEVCSPAGTTICGVHALERAGVRSAFMDAVEAATLRAREQGS